MPAASRRWVDWLELDTTALEVGAISRDEVDELIHRAAGADADHLMSGQPRKGGLCRAALVFQCIRHR